MTIFDRLTTLADATRSRLLAVLDRHELTVSELCTALQLPQSTVSRHLRVLADEGWLVSRADGTSRRYQVAPELDESARDLWRVVSAQLEDRAIAEDEERVAQLLAQRRTRSQEFFSSASGQWDGVRAELFGDRSDLFGLVSLLPADWTVGDLGCGTGRICAALSPWVRRVIGVDASEEMLRAARARLGEGGNVELREGPLEALPVADLELDAAVLSLVLHYVAEPAEVIVEAARVLRSGGTLLVIDMMSHAREEYRTRMGHLWQGFSEEELLSMLRSAGFVDPAYQPLPQDASAKGPLLFAARATKV
jgi:ArsR family transcriptional regulator